MNKKTPENVARAKKMHADGITIWEIADHFQIHENTAGMWINEDRAEKHRQQQRVNRSRHVCKRPQPSMTTAQANALIAQLNGLSVRTLVGIEPGNACLGRLAGEMLETNDGPRPLEAIILKRGWKRQQFRQAIAALQS